MKSEKTKISNTSIAIRFTKVSKKYEIHHERPTFVEKFFSGKNETFWALKDINLTINTGDRVGIIGANGSGKTTLLKIIAGITNPTEGIVQTNGKIVSLIDLEAGFHPDLSGIQNIYLNGMLLGLSKSYLTANLQTIINYADIRQFIDTPLFTYSQGMKFRLAYAIAIVSNPKILLMDEVFVTGDESFQAKTQHTIQSLQKDNTITTIITSHIAGLVLAFASSYYELLDGHIYKIPGAKIRNMYRTQDKRWRSKILSGEMRMK